MVLTLSPHCSPAQPTVGPCTYSSALLRAGLPVVQAGSGQLELAFARLSLGLCTSLGHLFQAQANLSAELAQVAVVQPLEPDCVVQLLSERLGSSLLEPRSGGSCMQSVPSTCLCLLGPSFRTLRCAPHLLPKNFGLAQKFSLLKFKKTRLILASSK